MSIGNLYIVATPIGNLKDITLRAIDVLKQVDTIVCEDTRVSGKLLKALSIAKPLISYNNYDEAYKTSQILSLLLEGKDIALISDAGTPLISDPGFLLVQECYKHKVEVYTIPGACSLISALTLSGLPLHKFLFLGFLDKSSYKRQKILSQYLNQGITIAIFESPHRLLALLIDICKIFGDAQVVVIARELTKLFEEVKTDNVANLIEFYDKTSIKGEIIVLFYIDINPIEVDNLQEIIKEHMPYYNTKELAKYIAERYNLKKNVVYDEILKIKSN